jgi:secondary thiamine-phosphate synthase enzyme
MLEVTPRLRQVVAESGIDEGLCHVFVRHTSASLVVQENADPSARRDLERFFDRVAPDGDPRYEHDAEGPDDMAAHIRAALTRTSETFIVADGALVLGTWQGVYLFEHRHAPHERTLELLIAPSSVLSPSTKRSIR